MNNLYETSDLGLASSLSCLGYKVTALDRHNPRRVVFCFETADGLQEAVNGYWNGVLRLPPAALFLHQKALKQRLYDERHV